MNSRRSFFDAETSSRTDRKSAGAKPPAGRVSLPTKPGPPRRKTRSGNGRPRSFLLWILVILGWGVQAALAVAIGVLIFDRVLMPRFVMHGAEVEVPQVHGVAVKDAVELLEQAGLDAIVASGKYTPIADAGTILESSPDPGLLVKAGRKVFLTPSLGVESQTVPDLRSLSLRLASTRLQDSGLEVGSVDYTATDEVPEGVVLASTPAPGSPVVGDGKVSLLMSRGRAAVPFWMPNLVGRAGIETAAWLEACGFEVEMKESSFPGTPGDVLRHEPRAGEPIYTGEPVELVLARADSDGFDDLRGP